MCDIRLSDEQRHGIKGVVESLGFSQGTPKYLVMRARIASTILMGSTYGVIWDGNPATYDEFLTKVRVANIRESLDRVQEDLDRSESR